MRPIIRGKKPIGFAITKYQQARGTLIQRLGEYCCYCEMHLDASLAIEHVKPIKPSETAITERILDWNNMLLSCANCNSHKGNEEIAIDQYIWPDKDNSYEAFNYGEGGSITINSSCNQTTQIKAQNTIKLFGLNLQPETTQTASDRRWLNRIEVWEMAKRAKLNYQKIPHRQMMEQIIDTAKAKGYWSIWMTVFNDTPVMLQELINAFPGTNKSYFC